MFLLFCFGLLGTLRAQEESEKKSAGRYYVGVVGFGYADSACAVGELDIGAHSTPRW